MTQTLVQTLDPEPRARPVVSGKRPFRLPSRADHVGSFLRPRSVIEAREHRGAGNIDYATLRGIEDEPVAEIMFNELAIDAFFLEYDDPRSGDFAPLRFLPKGRTVVLGLVTTKLGELESKDEVKRWIDDATKFVDIDQLALSPQCGFASTVHSNDITTTQQADKIRLVIEVAEEVWG